MSGVYGQQGIADTEDEFNTLMFAIKLYMQKVQTATPVKVVSCTNDGGLSPVGTVVVQPLVNQRNGDGTATPHGQIYNIPYCRWQGGLSAIILDPAAGDIGLMVVASRDISLVKATAAQANPGSLREFDWADGIYVSGMLNGTPTQYVRFLPSGGGIDLVSPGTININGTTIDPDGNIVIKSGSTITDGNGVVLETHQHNPGTYEVGSSPVTGKSSAPTA